MAKLTISTMRNFGRDTIQKVQLDKNDTPAKSRSPTEQAQGKRLGDFDTKGGTVTSDHAHATICSFQMPRWTQAKRSSPTLASHES